MAGSANRSLTFGRQSRLGRARRSQENQKLEELLTIGPASLERFLERWYGPPTLPAPPLSTGLPNALARWYQLAGSYGRPLVHQNQLLEPAEFQRENEKVVFYVENQGVWLWAFDETETVMDPGVFDREAEPGRQWQSTFESLHECLIHVAVFEAILGTDIGASNFGCTRSELDLILRPLARVGLPAWRWPGPEHRLYCGRDILACAGATELPGSPIREDSSFEVFIAGSNLDALAYLDDLPIKWDDNSRTDAS
jgi:hypothetical protein